MESGADPVGTSRTGAGFVSVAAKPISKPDNPLRENALEEADKPWAVLPYVDAHGQLPDTPSE